MKKNLLIILGAILTVALALVLALAKDTAKPKETGKATAIQPTEPNEIIPKLIQIKPKPKMMTDLSKLPDVKRNLQVVKDQEAPFMSAKPASYCEVQMFSGEVLVQMPRYIYNPNLPDAFLTFQDPKTSLTGSCTAPQYPFKVVDVSMSFRSYGTTGNTCTTWVHGVVYEADMTDPACPKPGALLARTADIQVIVIPNYTLNYLSHQPLLDSVCIYQPYFAGFVWDSIPDKDTLCGFSPRFNLTGTACFDYEDRGTGWFDFGAANGIGPTYFWSSGYVKDQNTCPPDTHWFFKRAYVNAPCGLPDFEQYDHGFPDNGGAYCGPTAKADCLWWLWARGVIPKFWTGNDWTSLASQIAALAQTDPNTGTECDNLFQADQQLVRNIPLWLSERTIYAPTFDTLDDQLRKCEDVILLLGFWYEEPPGSGHWLRFGGHFVTMSGVNTGYSSIAISDPAFDNAEIGQPGFICHSDPFPHIGNPLVHDNPANVSKDVFLVANSPSPGGVMGLPLYWAGRDTAMHRFAGQNFRSIHLPDQGPVLTPGTPVFTEIEQAIIISPASRYEVGEVDGSHGAESDNNHGGIEAHAVDFGAGLFNGLYYGSFGLGNSDTTMCFDYGNYYPTRTFTPQFHPDLQSFNISGAAGTYTVQQLTNKFTHTFIPGLDVAMYAFGFWVPVGGTEDCEYVIEDVYVLTNNSASPITGLVAGYFMDYDVSSGGTSDKAGFDQAHNSLWLFDTANDSAVFGFTKKPAVVGDVPITGWVNSQLYRVYPAGPTGGGIDDSLYSWLTTLGWGSDGSLDSLMDKSIMEADPVFDLQPGQVKLEKYIKWGYKGKIASGGDARWRRFLYNVLHQEGFYRGDVTKDGNLTISDVIYLISYLFRGGPSPIEFVDQADVNGDEKTSVSDIVYIINYLFKNGSAPIDRNRFLASSPYVDPSHKSLAVRNPGLCGDPAWKDLGK